MNFFESALLGFVQGLTEFFPISSSGHLVIFQNLLGLKEPEIFFDVCLHIGTLFAVCIFLRNDLVDIARVIWIWLKSPRVDTFRILYKTEPPFRLAVLTLVSTLVTICIVVLFRDVFERMFTSITLVATALLFTGSFLFFTRRLHNNTYNTAQTGIRHSIALGLAQSLAITPGISRSGSTISCALYMGMDRELAVRFSFLLSIPSILGAAVLQLDAYNPEIPISSITVGTLTAAGSGYIALKILSRVVKKGNLWFFAFYCWAVGLLTLFFNGI